MTKNTPKFTPLSVVPFVQKPVDPGRAGRIQEMKEYLDNPTMKAALAIFLDKDGAPVMVCTNDDPMLVAYLYRIGDAIVGQYVAGEVGLDDVALDDED